MQFDVIIGNLPYQLSDGGHGTSAPDLSTLSEQAKKLDRVFVHDRSPRVGLREEKALDEFRGVTS